MRDQHGMHWPDHLRVTSTVNGVTVHRAEFTRPAPSAVAKTRNGPKPSRILKRRWKRERNGGESLKAWMRRGKVAA